MDEITIRPRITLTEAIALRAIAHTIMSTELREYFLGDERSILSEFEYKLKGLIAHAQVRQMLADS